MAVFWHTTLREHRRPRRSSHSFTQTHTDARTQTQAKRSCARIDKKGGILSDGRSGNVKKKEVGIREARRCCLEIKVTRAQAKSESGREKKRRDEKKEKPRRFLSLSFRPTLPQTLSTPSPPPLNPTTLIGPFLFLCQSSGVFIQVCIYC